MPGSCTALPDMAGCAQDNRDKRVELLQQYARRTFPATRFLDYALTIERYTLTKAPNLVLNVDGCIGALFLDLLHSSRMFTDAEIQVGPPAERARLLGGCQRRLCSASHRVHVSWWRCWSSLSPVALQLRGASCLSTVTAGRPGADRLVTHQLLDQHLLLFMTSWGGPPRGQAPRSQAPRSMSPDDVHMAQDVVKIGYLNGLFVLARSIGLIGHALDQKRLQQPLYRHPWDEVLYTK